MTTCDLYKQHKWKFACKLQNDYVEDKQSNTTIEGKVIQKTIPVVRQDYSFKLLFYCPCGRLRLIDGSSITSLNSGTIDSYDAKIKDG